MMGVNSLPSDYRSSPDISAAVFVFVTFECLFFSA